MVRITSSKESFLVEFLDSDFYLRDGSMSFPKNSLSLVCDESDIITFKRIGNNDVIFSALLQDGLEIDGTAATKENVAELFDEATTSPVGSDPATTVTDVEVSQDGSQLDFVNESGNTVYSVNMSQYLTDVTITGAALVNGELILYSSNGDAISVDLSEMMSDYYTQQEADAAIDDAVAEEASIRQAAIQALETTHNEDIEHLLGRVETLESDKADKTSIDALEAHIDETDEVTARALNELQENKASKTELQEAIDNIDLSSKQDVLTPGDNITIENNVISASFDGSNFYTKEEIDNAERATSAALNDLNIKKLDASAYTPVDLSNYYTKDVIDENERVTSEALNDLNAKKLNSSVINNYYNKTAIDTMLGNYYGKSEIDTMLGNYYGKSEIDTMIGNYYDKTEIDTMIGNYYDKTEIDTMIGDINAALSNINGV